jgi:tRNA (guanine37-N1)-methyltransferase
LRPIRFMDSYNHLSVRSAASIMVDRLVGDVG